MNAIKQTYIIAGRRVRLVKATEPWLQTLIDEGDTLFVYRGRYSEETGLMCLSLSRNPNSLYQFLPLASVLPEPPAPARKRGIFSRLFCPF